MTTSLSRSGQLQMAAGLRHKQSSTEDLPLCCSAAVAVLLFLRLYQGGKSVTVKVLIEHCPPRHIALFYTVYSETKTKPLLSANALMIPPAAP